ncbi:MAG: RNA polymerase sigma factor [Clostridia bacterium]
MEKDLDKKLYNDYLNGEKEAFEILYNKYKNKIEYFIYNIVKDYQKAEDIAQETFIYVIQHQMRENSSFKYYIYLVARSKALNYINVEKRRNEITEKYFANDDEQIEKDVLDIITAEESKKELLESIELLDERYKNAIYLVNIEGLSYEETSKILGETLQNTKNLIHRGKKQLRKILLKKGFNEMNKVLKIFVIIICTTIALSGIVYATTVIYNRYIKNNTNHNITMNPSYQSTLDENTINNLWVGTLDLAWKDLEEKIGLNKIELEGEMPQIANDLNESTFSKEMLNPNDYKINVERTVTNGYKIDATLNKELNFLESFDNFNDYKWTFGNSDEAIKYFGINNASPEKMNKNVEILFYNKLNNGSLLSNDMAIKLKTKEGDEIILYRTDDKKSFDEYYEDIKSKTKNYKGRTEFSEDDELRVPYVKVNGMINYNQLYDKKIKNSKGLYIYDVVQNVNFYLNERGCNLSSKATMVTEYMGIGEDTKYCYFQNTFIIFMKEKKSDKPYFALKVDNNDILEKIEETDEPKIFDSTTLADREKYYSKYLQGGEYKFFEDEKYEYYYPTQKTQVVQVYFKNGDIMTAEEALKQGKISMDLLDKYEIEYFKKEK